MYVCVCLCVCIGLTLRVNPQRKKERYVEIYIYHHKNLNTEGLVNLKDVSSYVYRESKRAREIDIGTDIHVYIEMYMYRVNPQHGGVGRNEESRAKVEHSLEDVSAYVYI